MTEANADEQALAERVVAAMMAKDAFSQWLGIEVVDVQPNASTVRMTVRGDMVNGFGVCHGGVTFALADSALAFASNTDGHVTMSIENSMTYPKAVSIGDVLTATAEQESASKRLGFFRVTVRRSAGGGETVALFRGTVYKTDRAFFQESE
ncbi:MAG: hydroxyphenylacetyl-CoA thioesterase PaaI [bacterium]